MPDLETQPDYTPEEVAAAQQIVDSDRAKKATELNARRMAYLAAVSSLVLSPEWKAVWDGLAQIASVNEADGLLSFHVNSLLETADKLAKAVSPSAG